MDWKPLLASITGSVDPERLWRHAYLVVAHRLLRPQLTGRVRRRDGERHTRAAIGLKLGTQAREEMATVGKPETMLAWQRTVMAKPRDGSQKRPSLGRPPLDAARAALVVRIAQENRAWGSDRLAGALHHRGDSRSAQPGGNLCQRHRLPPAPPRKKRPPGGTASGRRWTGVSPRTACTAGNNNATSMPMIVITTSSSTNVKPKRR